MTPTHQAYERCTLKSISVTGPVHVFAFSCNRCIDDMCPYVAFASANGLPFLPGCLLLEIQYEAIDYVWCLGQTVTSLLISARTQPIFSMYFHFFIFICYCLSDIKKFQKNRLFFHLVIITNAYVIVKYQYLKLYGCHVQLRRIC